MSDLNVLLVDDEPDFLAALTEKLIDHGLNVLSATDGNEALQIMKRLRIDVVVLDVIMPERGGMETLREIKTNHPETEVIMLTGVADIRTAIEAMRRDAFDYLIKPVRIERLLSRMQDANTRKRLRCELKAAENVELENLDLRS